MSIHPPYGPGFALDDKLVVEVVVGLGYSHNLQMVFFFVQVRKLLMVHIVRWVLLLFQMGNKAFQ